MTGTRRKGIMLALATACISGFAIFLNGNGVRAFGSPASYTTAKNAVAALALILIVAATYRAGTRLTKPSGARQWIGVSSVAVIGGAVPFVLFFEGLARASSTQAAVVHKSLVIWVALLAVVLLREKLKWPHFLAIGSIVAAQIGLAGGVGNLAALAIDTGVLMILGATLLWSVEVIVAKRLLKTLTPWTLSIARMGGGAVVLLAWSAAQGALGSVVPSTLAQWGWVLLTGLLLAGYVMTWHHALASAQAVDVTAVLVVGVLITAALNGVFKGADVAAQLPSYSLIFVAGALLVWNGLRPPVALSPVQRTPA